MNEVSVFRLNLLRAAYLFIVLGFGIFKLPGVIQHVVSPDGSWGLMESVVACMQVTFWLLTLFGLRYPLQMLPVLLWEMIWKSIWLLIVALPLWRSGQIDESTLTVAYNCMVGIVVPIALPWSYLFAQYIRKPGDRWRN